MAVTNNSAFGPPPLATDITQQGDETGTPWQSRMAQTGVPNSKLQTTWGQWFTKIYEILSSLWSTALLTESTQANLAALAGTLDAADTGMLTWISDYAHMLEWTGTGWRRGPGDLDHSDTFADFGTAPTDTGWHACDGSTVSFLKYDGTLGSRVLPNLAATPAFALDGSAYSATIIAPVVPTFTGTPAALVTALVTATGAVNAVTTIGGSGTSYTPAGTVALSGKPVSNYSVVRYYRQ